MLCVDVLRDHLFTGLGNEEDVGEQFMDDRKLEVSTKFLYLFVYVIEKVYT